MQSTETKGVEEKLDDETSGSTGFSGIKKKDLLLLRDKPVFLDPQLLDFPVQRRAGNSEFRCRTFWARNFPFTFRKDPFNDFSLLILESVWQIFAGLAPGWPAKSFRSKRYRRWSRSPIFQIICSSRIFPGHPYDWHRSRVSLSILQMYLPVAGFFRASFNVTPVEETIRALDTRKACLRAFGRSS
jgi:hypothetical protein